MQIICIYSTRILAGCGKSATRKSLPARQKMCHDARAQSTSAPEGNLPRCSSGLRGRTGEKPWQKRAPVSQRRFQPPAPIATTMRCRRKFCAGERGLKVTTPRLLVLKALLDAHRPTSAQELLDSLLPEGLDQVTVYRTLTTLTEIDLGSRSAPPMAAGASRFMSARAVASIIHTSSAGCAARSTAWKRASFPPR